ncbi:unnamed protein product [Cuscuta campestris]|uniref:Uncharacterized protein n=1 Tax=Cuscuta campestris TaxID=132261 RepID=A0A484LPL8_9ASTE|nr:unnamed protein product [Cuscuta campestris]
MHLLKSITLDGSFMKQVIHEFYCNLDDGFVCSSDELCEKCFVHRKYYDLCPATVNNFLGLDDVQDVVVSEAVMWKELTNGA